MACLCEAVCMEVGGGERSITDVKASQSHHTSSPLKCFLDGLHFVQTPLSLLTVLLLESLR